MWSYLTSITSVSPTKHCPKQLIPIIQAPHVSCTQTDIILFWIANKLTNFAHLPLPTKLRWSLQGQALHPMLCTTAPHLFAMNSSEQIASQLQ